MDIKEINQKLENTLNVLKSDLSGIQAGKVTEVLLKNVNVSYEDGRKVNLFATSTIKIAGAKSISVHPFSKDDIMAVEKAINNAGLGVSTGRQDHSIIVTFPDITKERREELAKSVNKFANDAKISSRDIRHNYLNANKKPSKEENIKLEKEIQKEIDKFNAIVDDLTKKKQQEIMKI